MTKLERSNKKTSRKDKEVLNQKYPVYKDS